jgi:hypothetical protein
MLQNGRIKEIALEVARANLGLERIDDALVEPAMNSLGEDAFRIIVVVRNGERPRLTGHATIQFMLRLDDRLEQEGEPRQTIPEFATPEDLAEEIAGDDDSES